MAEITKNSTLREVLNYYAEKNKRGKSFVTEGVKFFKDIADEKGSAVKLFTPDKAGKTLLARTLPNVSEDVGLKQPMQNLRQVGLVLKGIVSPNDKLLETLPDASTNTEKNLRIFGIAEPAKAKSLVTIRVNENTMNDFFSQIHEFKKDPKLEAIADATLFNLNTGLRPNAAAGLKVGGTYFPESGAIYIDAETKGAKGRRINVPLSPLADSILQKRIADAKVKDNQFFVKPDGKVVTSKDMTSLLKKIKIKDFVFDASTNKYYDSLAPEGEEVPGKRGAGLLRNIHTKIGQKSGVPFERIAYLQGRSLVSAAQGSVGEVVTYATDFPGDIDPQGFDAQKANQISSIFAPSVEKYGYNLTGKEARITPKTKGFESYFDAPVLDEVDESTLTKMKMGENDILPTTEEINSFADFTQEELDELEAGGITSAKKEASGLTDKLKKIGKTVIDKGSKVVAGAIGVEAFRALTTDPAAFAKDVVIDTALERGLGTGPGAVVGFSLAPTRMGTATLDNSQVGEYTRIPLEEEEGFINQNQIGRQ
tara:strand:+ start:53 stop:1666 length:1614 start_codon:yes stop_codon:yes gene_type:complete